MLCTGHDAHRNSFSVVDICHKCQRFSIISEYVWNVRISKNVEIYLLRSPGHKHSPKTTWKISASWRCWVVFHWHVLLPDFINGASTGNQSINKIPIKCSEKINSIPTFIVPVKIRDTFWGEGWNNWCNKWLWQWSQFESWAWAHAAPVDPVAVVVLWEASMPPQWPAQGIAKKLQSPGIILILSLCSKGVQERTLNRNNLHLLLSHFHSSLPISLPHFGFCCSFPLSFCSVGWVEDML